MKFVLEIRLGNAAMETADDIARALHLVAHALENRRDDTAALTPGFIRDENGNRVGSYSFFDEE